MKKKCHLRLVDPSERFHVEEPQRIKEQLEWLDQMKKVIEEGRIEQFHVAYDEIFTEPDEDGDVGETHSMFWNQTENIDQAIGYAERFKLYLSDIAEIGPDWME